ncbi:unnamed protein product [Adineta steineri]|uniref:Uncharacterized protein n=2 Tax=Adineta steineri TaxID=433720 RepID=A0A819IR62_9BILA|nr:unnamed protein product [Adineta steineri]
MSERIQRDIGLPGTCGLPCLTTGNKCINSGVCNDKNICDCTNLPSCGGIQCFNQQQTFLHDLRTVTVVFLITLTGARHTVVRTQHRRPQQGPQQGLQQELQHGSQHGAQHESQQQPQRDERQQTGILIVMM